MVNRLEIRLDAEHSRKLNALVQSRHVSVSDLVRALLDREYEEWLRTQRLSAARAIAALSAEDVPEPELLERQLGEAYESSVC